MAPLHSARGAFGEQNLPLQLLLGLLSGTERVARLLPADASDAAPAAQSPDRFTALLLGMVSFRRSLLVVLESARAERAAPDAAASAPGPLRDLLR